MSRAAWFPPRAGGWRLALGSLLALLALLFLAREVDVREALATLHRADPALVLAALALLALHMALKAARWRWLLGQSGATLSLWRAAELLMIGQALNTLLPARAGDLSRAFLAGDHGLNRSYALGTIAVEKLLDLAAYMLLLLLLLLWAVLPSWLGARLPSLTVLVGGGLVASWLLASRRRTLIWLGERLPVRLRALLLPRLHSLLASLEVLRSPRAMALGVGASLLAWLSAALVNLAMLRALAVPAPPVAALLLLIALQVGITLAAVPASVGIFEGICVLVLALFGVGEGVALGYGLLLHSFVLLPVLLGILLALRQTGGVRLRRELPLEGP